MGEQFRSHVGSRPQIACESYLSKSCDTEICKHRGTIGTQQDVVWLDVAMNDS